MTKTMKKNYKKNRDLIQERKLNLTDALLSSCCGAVYFSAVRAVIIRIKNRS